MKRESSDLLLCRVFDANGTDRFAKLEGLRFDFDGQSGSVTPAAAGAWQAKARGAAGSWKALEAHTEYELRDGLMLRDGAGHEYTVAMTVFVDRQQQQAEPKKSKPESKKSGGKALPMCNYGAECYRRQNAEHCEKYRHPGVNEINRARAKAEHNLADQITPDWEEEEEEVVDVDDEENDGVMEAMAEAEPEGDESMGATNASLEIIEGGAEKNHVLAFPSISTATFAFDASRAMTVLVEEASEFLRMAPPNVQLVLCDVSDSTVLKMARKQWAAKHGSKDDRFRTAVVDLTRVNSFGAIVGATVVVNSTNKDLSPNGSGVNQALYTAVADLDKLTAREHSPPAGIGVPMLVELPENNAWRQREGVSAIMHILGPNMNPSRPDCLNGDYAKGCAQLAITYRNVFLAFLNHTRLLPQRIPLVVEQPSPVKKKKGAAAVAPASGGGGGAGIMRYFNPLQGRAAAPAASAPAPAPAPTPASASTKASIWVGEDNADEGEGEKKAKVGNRTGGWSMALVDIATNPELYGESVLFCDDRVVAVRDKFPKARVHVLVMPRRVVDDFAQLKSEDVPLLRYMEEVGREVQRKVDPEKKLVFRMGYHAVPSLKQVHMHVISQDFDSDALKNKKHWNSFTTRFFVDSKKFIGMLVDEGTVFFDKKE